MLLTCRLSALISDAMTEQEQLLKKRFEELADTAYRRDIVTFSSFLDLQEQHIVHSINWRERGVSLVLSGGYDLAERRMAAFLPEALIFEWSFPYVCIEITPQSLKFSEPLTHRDFLGAVLNLGIDRNRLGDLMVHGSCAYLFCEERIAQFICNELCRVRHTVVHSAICEDTSRFQQPDFKEISGSVASIRLDSIIALAFQESRSSMVSLIEGGKVFVNGKQVVSNGYALKENDIISVRGKGKCRFGHVMHQTKKGRNMVVVYRYQ